MRGLLWEEVGKVYDILVRSLSLLLMYSCQHTIVPRALIYPDFWASTVQVSLHCK